MASSASVSSFGGRPSGRAWLQPSPTPSRNLPYSASAFVHLGSPRLFPAFPPATLFGPRPFSAICIRNSPSKGSGVSFGSNTSAQPAPRQVANPYRACQQDRTTFSGTTSGAGARGIPGPNSQSRSSCRIRRSAASLASASCSSDTFHWIPQADMSPSGIALPYGFP